MGPTSDWISRLIGSTPDWLSRLIGSHAARVWLCLQRRYGLETQEPSDALTALQKWLDETPQLEPAPPPYVPPAVEEVAEVSRSSNKGKNKSK